MEFCGRNAVLVAHNIAFDYNILNSNLKRYRNEKCEAHFDKKFDSITIAKLIAPRLASYKLKGLIDYFGVEGINSHNALDDVKATATLIRKLHSVFNEKLRTAQSEYLQEQFNASGFAESFINKFSPIYSASDEKLDTIFTLRGLAESYYALLPPRKQEGNDDGYDKSEIHKLLNHFDAYADSNNEMILKQRLEKYVPEYLAFKESDLYLGTERVIVSTVWKAKGLEFDNVIVSEATDSTYPNYYSNTPEKKLEDARALYVALTRAKKRLFVTYHTRYESYPRSYPRYPSRYLKAVKNRFHYDYDVW
jgi:DNA helicase-2/ATP-dependent DNA helicase PcrA